MNLKKTIAVATLSLVTTLSACTPQEFALYTTNPAALSQKAPSVRSRIDRLVYTNGNVAPARAAYRAVAEARGWTASSIRTWEPFVLAVVGRESGYCPNVKRGAITTAKGAVGGCVLARQGTYSDSGFGQVISINYRPTSPLCIKDHLCSSAAIIRTPWNSMTALLSLVEHNGRHPWCYTSRLRSGRVCRLAPAGKPDLTR
jgi:hypothetical protein